MDGDERAVNTAAKAVQSDERWYLEGVPDEAIFLHSLKEQGWKLVRIDDFDALRRERDHYRAEAIEGHRKLEALSALREAVRRLNDGLA